MFIYTEKPTGLFTVYLITNKTNNKRYIGIHKEKPGEDLYAYMGSGTDITKAIRNEGVDNFTKIILARFNTREEMIEMEKQLVTEDIANSEEYYNNKTGGGHPIMSEKTRQQMSESKSGENHPMYNKKHSKESRQKMSDSTSGEKNPNFGRTGEKHPLYGKTGENHPRYGMTHSEETLEMMRGENHPLYGRTGKNNPKSKLANIYCYKTDRLIAEGVVIAEWCRENDEYNQGSLWATTKADRTQPSTTQNRHHHKGIYARYTA